MTFGIVVFPGSNCDHDCYWGLKHELGLTVRFIWHRQRNLEGSDCIILPGGFAHGDYLRAGAIAQFSPVMDSVYQHAQKGKPVIGICNGFQVLTEIGLLPGALLRNDTQRFRHERVRLRIERKDTRFTHAYDGVSIIEFPIAHGQGRYYAPSDVIEELEARQLVLFRYCDAQGNISADCNPNGSLKAIAGIMNRSGNIMGLMPHPERRVNALLGGADGRALFHSIATFA